MIKLFSLKTVSVTEVTNEFLLKVKLDKLKTSRKYDSSMNSRVTYFDKSFIFRLLRTKKIAAYPSKRPHELHGRFVKERGSKLCSSALRSSQARRVL